MANAGGRGNLPHRLEAGHVYFDLDNPGQGPFVATGDEEVAPGANIIARDEVSAAVWESLTSTGWGEAKPGAGDRSYDQGAFGQEDSRRSDSLNARPPGAGMNYVPIESEEDDRRR